MAKILTAKDYGYRKVIRVVLNPTDPEFIHDDSSAHSAENTNGCPGESGADTICHTNWRIEEFIFDGEDRSDAALLEAVKQQVAALSSASSSTIGGIEGQDV